MYTLSISTSSNDCQVALLNKNKVINFNEISSPNSHSIVLAKQIDEILKKANIDFSQIENLLVDIGPGSFTGIRIGLSTLKGISVTTNIPIYGISSLDGYFISYFDELQRKEKDILSKTDRANDLDSKIIVCTIDGKNSNVFYKIFLIKDNSFEKIQSESFNTVDELNAILNELNNSLKKPIVQIGEKVENINSNEFVEAKINSSKFGIYFDHPEFLIKNPVPLYLKKPQAQIDLENKGINEIRNSYILGEL